ncbi:hypothetical protein [Acinetobacter piscicola]|uniref:hypothetical protein n=1 Tax=Acinetobacter piscicola TaxID=2006115 RepID=UPI001021FFD8|nr:hypothetical protein [Acinetobacter piscicola]RYL25122.1 hypothetical protein EWP19_13160 [Acinetobacter piscicola]
MVASTDIKFYVHTNNNAPQLSNNFGCMIDVLDACLVNGFGAQSVSTLKASGKVVTVTFGAAHNLMQYQVIKITGANQSEFNGEHRILSVPNANSFTFELANTATVTQASGTIVCSLPPLGWEKPFSSTHSSGTGGKAAYRSTNPLLPSRPFLRVVDELDPAYTATYAKYAKVGIVEDMTDINTMLGVQAPYDTANPDKNWVGTGSGTSVMNGWSRWYYAASAAFTSSASDSSSVIAGIRSWVLVGTKDYFYILPTGIPNNTAALLYGFGAFDKLLQNDISNNFLISTLRSNFTASVINARHAYTGGIGTDAAQKTLIQRSYAQNAQYVEANTLSLGVAATVFSGNLNYIGASSLTNSSPFTPVYLNESVLRGSLKGVYWLFQKQPYAHLELIENNGELFIALNCAPTSTEGQVVLKVGDL